MSRQRTDGLLGARGFSLVELMVALAIGLLLLTGALGVYGSSRQTLRVNERLAQLQDSARFILDLMEPDVRSAGFWGLTNRTDFVAGRAGPADPLAIAVTNDCEQNWAINLDRPVEGANAANPYPVTCLFAPDAHVPGTDVLVVRHAADTPTPPGALEAGRIYIRADQSHAQVFTGTTPPPGFGPEAQDFELETHAYFISQASDFAGDVPSLRRLALSDGGATPEIAETEILSGVEDMQVQFGLDTDGDGSVNMYVNPVPGLDASQVLSVRVWLRLRAETPETGFVDDARYLYADQDFRPKETPSPEDDALRRLLVTKTIGLRNRLVVPGS
jgi:prepilin-type N-terminal cleavage/methylation domain-containing protein